MAQTLLQLRNEAKQRSNQENKTLVADADWNRYINEAIGELYDLIVSAFPHYYVSSSQFTLSGSNTFALTSLTGGFYKLRGLDYMVTPSQPRNVRPFNFAERNRYTNLNFAGTYQIWWTPPPPTLVADGDTLDTILDLWSEFIPITAAIVAAAKEESPTDDLIAMKNGLIERINRAAPNRDAEPGQAADLMYGADDIGRRYSLEGTNLIVLGSAWADLYWA